MYPPPPQGGWSGRVVCYGSKVSLVWFINTLADISRMEELSHAITAGFCS